MNDMKSKITDAFARDELEQRKAQRATDIPWNYSAITPEWLTDILCDEQSDVRVTDFAFSDRSLGTTERQRINLKYSNQNSHLPKSVFCKATFQLTNRIHLAHTGGIHGEVTFSNRLRRLISIESPLCYYAAYDKESFSSIVVLEDLGDNVDFCTQDTEISFDDVDGQLKLLAHFHGYFYAHSQADGLDLLPTWPQRFNNIVRFDLEKSCLQGFVRAEEVIPDALLGRHNELWDATVKSVELHHNLPPTLSHGDVHIRNWYRVRDSFRMGLTDWQVANRGHWSRDVAYTIGSALTPDNRRAWEKELLARYVEYLHESGGPRANLDEAWTWYRQQMLSSLAFWTGTLAPAPGYPDMQPEEASLELIRRLASAVDDLDSLRAMEAA